MDLPPEIQALVCGNLPKEDLKNLRLSCNAYERAAVPYLFDRIFMSFKIADLRIAKLVVLQFKQYIRTLVFSSIYYEDFDRDEFESRFDWFSDSEHMDYAFQLYRRALKAQRETVQTGACPVYLTFALTYCPNIEKIILTDSSSSRPISYYPLTRHGSWHLDQCPIDCDLKDDEHIESSVLSHSGFELKGVTNPWRTILLALSTTSSSPREIAMEPTDEEDSLNTTAFKMPPADLVDAKNSFRALTKLRLVLDVDREKFSTNGATHYVHRNVARLLRAAINLECLAIEVNGDDQSANNEATTSFQDILRISKLPKLKSLILAGFTSTETELLHLLKYSPRLEHVCIEDHKITSGSWAQVASRVRAKLPLKSVDFNYLYGGFEEPRANREYIDHFGDVGKFFLANGPNPFSKSALEQ